MRGESASSSSYKRNSGERRGCGRGAALRKGSGAEGDRRGARVVERADES